MRVFVPHALALASVSLAAVLSSRVVPQEDSAGAADPPEEVTIRGQKTMTQYRLELERARDDVFRLFNEANRGKGTDITCRDEQATGRRIRQSVCRSNAENRSDAVAARGFLSGLLMSAGKGEGGTQAAANIATGAAQGGGESGEADALAKFELEWRRLLAENRDLYDAVVKYAELDDEYARARGAAVAPLPDLARGAPPESPAAVCEASTLTEYSQRNDVALVSGTVSLSGCPAGTTGGFTVVARVRNDAGETNAIEFDETWQRVDAQDHKFESEYPIGENVFLSSVRVRNLTCTCANAPQ